MGRRTTEEIAKRVGCYHDPQSLDIKHALRNDTFAVEKGMSEALRRARMARPDLESGINEADVILPPASYSSAKRKEAEEKKEEAGSTLEQLRERLMVAWHGIVNAKVGSAKASRSDTEALGRRVSAVPLVSLSNLQAARGEEEEEGQEEPPLHARERRRDRWLADAKSLAAWPLRFAARMRALSPMAGHATTVTGPGNLIGPADAGAAFVKGKQWKTWISWLLAEAPAKVSCGGNETLIGECGQQDSGVESVPATSTATPSTAVPADESARVKEGEEDKNLDNQIAALKTALRDDVSLVAGNLWGKGQLYFQQLLSKMKGIVIKGEEKAFGEDLGVAPPGRISPLAETGGAAIPGSEPDELAAGERQELRNEEEQMEEDASKGLWEAGFGSYQQDFYRPLVLSTAERLADELTIACLKKTNSTIIKAAVKPRRGFLFYDGFSFFPVVPGTAKDLPDHPLRLIERGQWWAAQEKVEIVVGANKDEASAFLLVWPFLFTEDLVRGFLESTVGEEHTNEIWKAYFIEGPQNVFLQALQATAKVSPKTLEPDKVEGLR
jgi:hypothetical protein